MSEYNRTIIAIGRQFGSGGREIGEKLAKELGIPFYDKELIALAGQRSGIDQSLLDDVDENATNSMLYSLVAGSYTPPNGFTAFPEESMTDKLFATQCTVVRELAEKSACVLVGRCCDYILRDNPHCVKIFIHAPMEARVKRIMRLYQLNEAKAAALIKKRINAGPPTIPIIPDGNGALRRPISFRSTAPALALTTASGSFASLLSYVSIRQISRATPAVPLCKTQKNSHPIGWLNF